MLSRKSVLDALLTLQGRTASGERRAISASAIAKHIGKSLADVKAVLAANEQAIEHNEKGLIIGSLALPLACQRGLVVQARSGVRGSSMFKTFWADGSLLRRFNEDRVDESRACDRFEADLKTSGKIICERTRDLPDGVLTQVWQEDGLIAAAENVAPNTPAP
jgi:hypothetical protein